MINPKILKIYEKLVNDHSAFDSILELSDLFPSEYKDIIKTKDGASFKKLLSQNDFYNVTERVVFFIEQ